MMLVFLSLPSETAVLCSQLLFLPLPEWTKVYLAVHMIMCTNTELLDSSFLNGGVINKFSGKPGNELL